MELIEAAAEDIIVYVIGHGMSRMSVEYVTDKLKVVAGMAMAPPKGTPAPVTPVTQAVPSMLETDLAAAQGAH